MTRYMRTVCYQLKWYRDTDCVVDFSSYMCYRIIHGSRFTWYYFTG